jgi:hypothetical protein
VVYLWPTPTCLGIKCLVVVVVAIILCNIFVFCYDMF